MLLGNLRHVHANRNSFARTPAARGRLQRRSGDIEYQTCSCGYTACGKRGNLSKGINMKSIQRGFTLIELMRESYSRLCAWVVTTATNSITKVSTNSFG